MTLYADPNRCPDCRGPLAAGASRCPGCDLELSGPLGQELFTVLGRADDLLRRMRHQQRAGRVPVAVGAPAGSPAVAAPAPELPADPSAAPPAPVRGSSVPKILLGLGAVCVLVAALVFLAVTWALLGVGGRTAVLVGFTVATGLLTATMARRTLSGATEALGLVTIGLATLDVVGARNAGWLGDPNDGTFTAILGGLLVAGGVGATHALGRTPVGRLVVGELAAVLGVLLLSLGLVDGSWSTYAGRHLVALLVAASVTAFVWKLVRSGATRYRIAAWGTAAVAVADWVALVGAGVGQLGGDPTTASVWGELDGWPLLAAAAAAGAVGAYRRLPVLARVTAGGAALVALGVALTSPAYDESTTVLTLTMLATALALTATTTLAPRPWGATALGAAFLVAIFLGVQTIGLLGTAATRYADTVATGWRGTLGGRLDPVSSSVTVGAPWLLPLCVAALLGLLWATARLVERAPAPRSAPSTGRRLIAAGAAAAVLVATLVLWPVPVWTVLASMLGAAAVSGGLALVRTDAAESRDAALVCAVALTVALPFSLFDEHLTGLALAVATTLLGALHLRGGSLGLALTTGIAAPLTLAALVGTVGEIAAAERPWTALVGLLVLAAVALGRVLLPSRVHTGETLGSVEAGAALGALVLCGGGVLEAGEAAAGWAAVYLTVAGVTATVMALLRDDRRVVGWLGGALLALATWVRLNDIGVREPEPYTLPSAVALLVVGWVHLRRHPSASTLQALTPGLALALVPSLLWVLAEPLGLRAVLLGLACLVLVVVGAQLRLAAPFLHGASVGLLVVLREATPFLGDTVPRWALIGAAGVLLIGLGVTWEQRLQQARAAARYVTRMR